MKPTARHSPLPWVLDLNQIKQPVLSKRRRITCPPDADGIRDAAHIVHCVNTHDALVDALDKCVHEMKDAADLLSFHPDDYFEAINLAENAITLARKESVS